MKKSKFLILSCLILSLGLILRFWRLGTLTSPYWEEVALAYDSYSLLKTTNDHHGNFLPLTSFESFGDYKASAYFYFAIPFIKLFGLNTLAVRLPSALAGLAVIVGVAVMTRELALLLAIKKKKHLDLIFLTALFLTTISNWAITFSRAAWESNLATSLLVWGINCFFLYQKKVKKKYFYYLPLSVLFFILASYSYHAQKITAPLVGLTLVVFYLINTLKKQKKFKSWQLVNLLSSFLLAVFLFLPLFKASQTQTGQQRFLETAIFSDLNIIEKSNQKIAQYDNAIWAKFYWHRYLLFAKEILDNFLSHFSFDYLFISGDGNWRHHPPLFGQLYYLDAIFLLLSVLFLLRKKNNYRYFFIFYFLATVLPSALTTDGPHSLRTLAVLPIFIVLITFGIFYTLKLLKQNKRAWLIIGLLYLLQPFIFANFYFKKFPSLSAQAWQDGYEELMTSLDKVDDGQKEIYVTREQGRPAIYHWFYNQVDPSLVQGFEAQALQDQSEFLTFYNWRFIRHKEELELVEGEVYFAGSKPFIEQLAGQKELLFEIHDRAGNLVWQVIDYQP